MANFKKLVRRLNAPRVIAVHLFGKNHTRTHQCIVGALVMLGGVELGIVLKHYITIEGTHVLIEAFAAGIHGIGLTPYIEWIMELTENA